MGLLSIVNERAGKLIKEEVVNVYLNLTDRDKAIKNMRKETFLICYKNLSREIIYYFTVSYNSCPLNELFYFCIVFHGRYWI